MENKILYKLTLDKEIEKVVESTRKNKKTGEETTTKKTVTEKKPVEVQILRPSRRQLEEAELVFSVEMSNCVKRGIFTKAMLAKKYSDSGGLFSEEDASDYADFYKDALDLQNEYMRLDTIKKKTKAHKDKLEEVKSKMAVNRKHIVDFESNFQSLFDHTADVKAQNKILLWYCLNLTKIYDEDSDKFVDYFQGKDMDEKTSNYYDLEESDDEFYFNLIKQVSTVIAFWFFNQASSQNEVEEIIDKVEKGEL
jgi:hypothetical protein